MPRPGRARRAGRGGGRVGLGLELGRAPRGTGRHLELVERPPVVQAGAADQHGLAPAALDARRARPVRLGLEAARRRTPRRVERGRSGGGAPRRARRAWAWRCRCPCPGTPASSRPRRISTPSDPLGERHREPRLPRGRGPDDRQGPHRRRPIRPHRGEELEPVQSGQVDRSDVARLAVGGEERADEAGRELAATLRAAMARSKVDVGDTEAVDSSEAGDCAVDDAVPERRWPLHTTGRIGSRELVRACGEQVRQPCRRDVRGRRGRRRELTGRRTTDDLVDHRRHVDREGARGGVEGVDGRERAANDAIAGGVDAGWTAVAGSPARRSTTSTASTPVSDRTRRGAGTRPSSHVESLPDAVESIRRAGDPLLDRRADLGLRWRAHPAVTANAGAMRRPATTSIRSPIRLDRPASVTSTVA